MIIIKLILVFSLASGINCVLWPCELDSDCTVDTSICHSSKICKCPAGYTFSDDVSKCIKVSLYGENCESSNQCSHMLTGSICNRVCECAEGYTYIRGRCKQLSSLGATCNDTSDCLFGYDRESVICAENVCKCSEGYYKRSENICRRKSMSVGEPCIVHQDCHGDSLECKAFKCVNVSEKRLSKDIGVQTNFNNVETKNAATSFELFNISVEEKKTKSDDKFGQSCSNINEPCPELAHSICIQEFCQCKNGYYHRNGLCVAEIGEIANSDELCENTKRDSITKRCTCQPNTFANNTLRECVKLTPKIGDSCTINGQCSPFGAAYCSDVKLCQCQSYADYDESSELCIPKEGLGSYCQVNDESSSECANREPNTICIDNACVCQDKFVEIDSHCRPGENGPCSSSTDCALENAECLPSESFDDGDQLQSIKSTNSSVCKCKSGFISTNSTCLKEAQEYNEECIDSEQCKPLLGPLGKCIDDKCSCGEEHQHTNGQCNKKASLSEDCKKSSECFVAAEPERVECRNAICTCKFGYERDIERQMCRAVKKNNSSGRPSVMKVITMLLISAAVLITSAALKEAYFP